MLDCGGAGVEEGRKEEAGVDVSATWKGSRQLIRESNVLHSLLGSNWSSWSGNQASVSPRG